MLLKWANGNMEQVSQHCSYSEPSVLSSVRIVLSSRHESESNDTNVTRPVWCFSFLLLGNVSPKTKLFQASTTESKEYCFKMQTLANTEKLKCVNLK